MGENDDCTHICDHHQVDGEGLLGLFLSLLFHASPLPPLHTSAPARVVSVTSQRCFVVGNHVSSMHTIPDVFDAMASNQPGTRGSEPQRVDKISRKRKCRRHRPNSD